MNDKFDELANGVAQSLTRWQKGKDSDRCFPLLARAILCLAAAALLASGAHAEDLYVDVAAPPGGDGSADYPYWRITDAVVHARYDRQNVVIPASERIVIHVAAGTYRGSYDAQKLADNPQWEVLPIILNVPNLTLAGATTLDLDAQGLPTRVHPGPETVLTTPDSQFSETIHTLILITQTTDGAVGENVTVTGFDLKQKQGTGTADIVASEIDVDRVSRFTIRGNAFRGSMFGLGTRLASGSVEANLFDGHSLGVFVGPGSIAQPAAVAVVGNRARNNIEGGMLLSGCPRMRQMELGANTVTTPPLQITYDRNNHQDLQNIPDKLTATLSGNDISDNTHFGLRIFAYPARLYANADPTQPLTSSVHATLTGNSFSRNGDHGVWFDAGFSERNLPSMLTADFAVTFEHNTYTDNRRGPALFSFTVGWISIGGDPGQFEGFLNLSRYQITDANNELPGFDYDNPTADPFNGAPLSNTLIVNGTVIPPGTKVTPKQPGQQ